MSNDLPLRSDGGLWQLCAVLVSHNVPFFVDSGVLLGLWRSGALNSWEKDIDLAVHSSGLGALRRALPEVRDLGYEVTPSVYGGRIYAVSLVPVTPHGGLRAAVHVYYDSGRFLWSPQPQLYVPRPAPDIDADHVSRVGSLLRSALERTLYGPADVDDQMPAPSRSSVAARLARSVYRSADQRTLTRLWPLKEVYRAFTWLVPRDLVYDLGQIELECGTLPVPGDVPAYLTHRYGDWKTPVRDWYYYRDDGALVRRPPEVVLAQLGPA